MSALPLHPELHHGGWVRSWAGKFHYFEVGMTISECGAFEIDDSAERQVADPVGVERCGNCDRVKAATAAKLRAAEAEEGDW